MGRDRAAVDGRSRGAGSPCRRRSPANGGLILLAARPIHNPRAHASGAALHCLWFRPAPDPSYPSDACDMTSALFSPIRLADLELANRIVVSPMCQYSADDGV